jgi:hypothetical protein
VRGESRDACWCRYRLGNRFNGSIGFGDEHNTEEAAVCQSCVLIRKWSTGDPPKHHSQDLGLVESLHAECPAHAKGEKA